MELAESARRLGITDYRLLDDRQLQDSPKINWPLARIFKLLQEEQCDAIVSFDAGGVSGHANHCRLGEALTHRLMLTPRLYRLRSLPEWRARCTVLEWCAASMMCDGVVIHAGVGQFLRGLWAAAAHRTQFSRKRLFDVLSSSYFAVNTFDEI